MYTTLWSLLLRVRQFGLSNTPKLEYNKTKKTKSSPDDRRNSDKYLNKNNMNTDAKRLRFFNQLGHKAKVLKQFTRSYWYIVLPLHGVLTISYMSFFYLLSRKHNMSKAFKDYDIYDIDVDKIHLKYLPTVSKATLQDVVITVILMKVSTPVRYASSFFASKALVNFLRSNKVIQMLPMAKVVKKE